MEQYEQKFKIHGNKVDLLHWVAKKENTDNIILHFSLRFQRIILECPLQSGSSWPNIFRFRYLAKYQTVSYAFCVKMIDTT